MGKKRAIDSKIRRSQSFAKLTYEQRDLWQGLIEVADDQGRLPGTTAYIRSEVWPYDDVTLQEVQDDLAVLADLDYILLYGDQGHVYLQILNWWKYQPLQWAGLSDHPAPEGWIDRARYHGRGNEIITLNWNKVGGFPDGVKPVTNPLPSDLPTPLSSRGVNNGYGNGYGSGVNDINPGEKEIAGKQAAPAAASKAPLPIPVDLFLKELNAKRVSPAQYQELVALYEKYGEGNYTAAAHWAGLQGMAVGRAVLAIKGALPKWGQPKPGTGSGPPGKSGKTTVSDRNEAVLNKWLEGK